MTVNSEFKGYRKVVFILVFIAFTVQLGFSILSPVLQYYIEALEKPLTPPPEERQRVLFTADVVWYMAFNTAAFMFFRAPFSTYFGRLSDKIGRRKLIIIGLFTYVVISIALGLATAAWQVVIIRGLQGVASAMVWPVAEALLMENAPIDARTRMMTLYVMGLNIANLIGPGVGGWLYHFFYLTLHSNYAIDILRPTVLSPVPLFIAAAILGLFVRENPVHIHKDDGDVSDPPHLEDIELKPEQKRSIYVIYTTGLANGFGVGLIASVVIIFITEFIVKEPALIGSVMMVAGLTGLVLAYPLASIADKRLGKKNMAIFSMMLRTIGFFILPFVRDIISLFFVMALQNISFNTGMPSIRAIQADLTHRRIRGRVFGQQQTFFNVGMGIGALIGAALYIQYAHIMISDLPGVSVLFFLSGLISLLSAILIKKYVIG